MIRLSAQTAEERCFLPAGQKANYAAGNLRVLAVGGRGLVALYRPENEDQSSTDNPATSSLTQSGTLINSGDLAATQGPSSDQGLVIIDNKSTLSTQVNIIGCFVFKLFIFKCFFIGF